MGAVNANQPVKLSIVIPCYNEEDTLQTCVERVLEIADDLLSLELIIVDDHSADKSLSIALDLEKKHQEITVIRHGKNFGKGASLRDGFQQCCGDFVAVQDADLEYDPKDLKRLLIPLVNGEADVVIGSRFLSSGSRRVLYFWHYLGNKFLTLLSNMFTDLNLSDMETCYKIFRREIIQSIKLKENRFGFEPEIVAKVAHRRLRIFELGISYYGRTYEEGKKIGAKDGLWALYCIFRYNAYKAPLSIQVFIYLLIGGLYAIVNMSLFLILFSTDINIDIATPIAFIFAAIVNYFLCITLLFRHKARWSFYKEIGLYTFVVAMVGLLDLGITKYFFNIGLQAGISKLMATISVFILNFVGRRFVVFPEPSSGPWRRYSR